MKRPGPLNDALLAISLLTALPVKGEWPSDGRSEMSGWFAFVGLLLGGLAWGFIRLIEAVGWAGNATLLVAVAVIGGWAMMTRMLHWDGLADVADAVWGGDTVERRLEIMSDSRTGAFGATAVALVAAAQVAAVASLLQTSSALPLLAVPALARLAASFAAWLGTPARSGGLGRSVMRRPSISTVLPSDAVLVAVFSALYIGYGLSGLWFLLGGVALALVIPHFIALKVGGVTGDVMGASVLLCETALLGIAAIVWGA
jgi:adenosylcobinamide-GDP ribazoletransferase